MEKTAVIADEGLCAFKHPFKAANSEGILDELGLKDFSHRRLMASLAFGVEVGHYSRVQEMLQERAGQVDSVGDVVLTRAFNRFEEANNLASNFEQRYGPNSARNNSHTFWPNVWERNERLRAEGYSLAADMLMPVTDTQLP